MKKFQLFLKKALVVSPLVVLAACSGTEAKYQNLASGEKVYIIKDSISGAAIDSITREPVVLYVDLDTRDTIYGRTGQIVNNSIIKNEDGTYMVDETKIMLDGNEISVGDGYGEGEVKIKVDGDEMKIKTDDKKIKIDGDEKKVKYNN